MHHIPKPHPINLATDWMSIAVQGDKSGRGHELGLLWFWMFHFLPNSAWADGNLAEFSRHLGNMVENQI